MSYVSVGGKEVVPQPAVEKQGVVTPTIGRKITGSGAKAPPPKKKRADDRFTGKGGGDDGGEKESASSGGVGKIVLAGLAALGLGFVVVRSRSR